MPAVHPRQGWQPSSKGARIKFWAEATVYPTGPASELCSKQPSGNPVRPVL